LTAPVDHEPPTDLLSGISDIDALSHLLADLHNDLAGKVTRFRYLADLGEALGSQGTLFFGGTVAFNAWIEARFSFIQRNFAATILLCQSIVENQLAAFLDCGLMIEGNKPRITFRSTLKLCQDHSLISKEESIDLERLLTIRNPLSHYRTLDDDQNINRRAATAGQRFEALIEQDAWFAIGLVMRILAKPQFRLG